MNNSLSKQDRDLLNRLNAYFDAIELHVRQGEGWLILNANRQRTHRLSRFISTRLLEYSPLLSYYILSWRDFAIHAYVSQVELSANSDPQADVPTGVDDDGYRIADRVSQDIYYHMLYSDFLVLSGIAPSYPYETICLDQVLEQRQDRNLPTALITPSTMQGLEQGIRSTSIDRGFWDRFLEHTYNSSFIAF